MKDVRKTKIVCTLGPNYDKDDDMLRKLMLAGCNVCRFNFSHGDHEEQLGRVKKVKALREELGLPVAMLLDTKGPEVRLGVLKDDKKIQVNIGDTFTLTTEDIIGDQERITVTYKELINDVKVGSTILIDDGLVELTVKEITDTDIICEVMNPGLIGSKKGVNVPNVDLTMPFVSPKDHSDVVFAVENGYDFIAASFTRTADDVNEIRSILKENGGEDIKIIAKIENMQGVNNIDAIIEAADGVMVARGDMGVEIPMEDVPLMQKEIIKKATAAGKVVITATQMLDSMIRNPRPTRAEVTDVANAIYDGTSAIMLSGETAMGDYPIQAVEAMVRIATRTENDINYKKRFATREGSGNNDVTSAISRAACVTAHDLDAAIVTVSKSGRTVKRIAKYRPDVQIIGCTTSERTYHQLNLEWGVTPVMVDEKEDTTELINHAIEAAKTTGVVAAGENVVVTAGVPLGVSGTTNLIKVQEVK